MNAPAIVIHFDPIIVDLLPLLAFLCFVVAGPILAANVLVLTLRRGTRRVGLLMLFSGGAGFCCMAAAAALRTWSKAHHLPSIDTAVGFGLAGFAAFVTVGMLLHFRFRPA
jgi:hypothetical protein